MVVAMKQNIAGQGTMAKQFKTNQKQDGCKLSRMLKRDGLSTLSKAS